MASKSTHLLINLLVAPLVVGTAILIAVQIIGSRKTPTQRTPLTTVARVSVFESTATDVEPIITTVGKTRPHLSTSLASQVSGEIVSISSKFESGLAVAKDEWLVRIDPADYQTILSERESILAIAQQRLADETSRSNIAREDWIASGRSPEKASDFTLRKPQLAAAKAETTAAEAAVAKARLDIDRTTITAPFDAIVQSRIASPGNVISVGTALGEIFASAHIEVRIPLTESEASLITLPQQDATSGLAATITTPIRPHASWEALINRVEPTIDSSNQTIWIIGKIETPFANNDTFLPIGTSVNVTLNGSTLSNVHILPEIAVVDDAFIWLTTSKNTLSKLSIQIEHTTQDSVFARIAPSPSQTPIHVVTSPLASFREGREVSPEHTLPKQHQS